MDLAFVLQHLMFRYLTLLYGINIQVRCLNQLLDAWGILTTWEWNTVVSKVSEQLPKLAIGNTEDKGLF